MFGEDVEIAPKKTSVSPRRRTQFGLLTPATRTRLDVGLNLSGEPPTPRLREKGGMCSHVVAVTGLSDIDDELLGWLRRAHDRHWPSLSPPRAVLRAGLAPRGAPRAA